MLTTSPPKPPKCKHCKQRTDSVGRLLHDDCVDPWLEAEKVRKALEKARKAKIKASVDRALDKVRRERLKKPTQREKECREIIQAIARLRDRNDGCISCHVGVNYGGRWHGSHFRPAGNNAAVQFSLWNVHKSCAPCNLFKSGNLGPYRIRLVEKIGLERVEWLESQTQQVKTSISYLKRFKAVMGKRLRRMEKRA